MPMVIGEVRLLGHNQMVGLRHKQTARLGERAELFIVKVEVMGGWRGLLVYM